MIAESIIDSLSLLSNGIAHSSAIYGTQGLREEHLQQIKNSGTKGLTLVMDGDQAGRYAAIKNGYRIEDIGIKVKVILLPEEHDPNEYFLNGGTKERFLSLPQYPPLELAIRETDPHLTGKDFVSSVSPILDRMLTQAPLSWNSDLKAIKDHFKAENPSLNDLKAALKTRSEEKERKEQILLPVVKDRPLSLSLPEIFNNPSLSALTIPEEWIVTEKGISSIVMKADQCYEFPIAHAPCIISHMASNIETGTEFRELTFKQDGKTKIHPCFQRSHL